MIYVCSPVSLNGPCSPVPLNYLFLRINSMFCDVSADRMPSFIHMVKWFIATTKQFLLIVFVSICPVLNNSNLNGQFDSFGFKSCKNYSRSYLGTHMAFCIFFLHLCPVSYSNICFLETQSLFLPSNEPLVFYFYICYSFSLLFGTKNLF